MSDLVTLAAPAKLTLSFRVIGVRPDGYHLIDAEMVTLSLHDEITIDPAGDGVEVTGRHADGVPVDDSNLVRKALWLVERQAHVTIDKRIPHGGGLGGG
jgi:4-diphosphocytidyl-2-C-methyl-D-erythritol kinase